MELDKEKLAGTINQASREIVQEIILDLESRSGFGKVFTHSSDGWKKEVRAKWRGIILRRLSIFGLKLMKEVLGFVQDEVKKELASDSQVPQEETGE